MPLTEVPLAAAQAPEPILYHQLAGPSASNRSTDQSLLVFVHRSALTTVTFPLAVLLAHPLSEYALTLCVPAPIPLMSLAVAPLTATQEPSSPILYHQFAGAFANVRSTDQSASTVAVRLEPEARTLSVATLDSVAYLPPDRFAAATSLTL